MKTIMFKCDSCGKVSDAVPDRPSPDYSKRMPQAMGWYAIFSQGSDSASAMGVTLLDGAHACGKKCALELLDKALDATRTISLD